MFAHAIAARLLCEHPDSAGACGQCPSCHWFSGNNHPDFRHVRPEAEIDAEAETVSGERKKASRQIRIAQIRELEDFVFVGSHRGGARVVLVEPVDAMNVAAQNAILKILEEPSVGLYFLMVSSRINALLPTVLSRCRVLKLPKPSLVEAREWLAMKGETQASEFLSIMGGAPLRAMTESQSGRGAACRAVVATLAQPGSDSLGLAARWEAQLQTKDESALPMESLIELVQKWILDLTERKLAGRGRYFEHHAGAMESLAARANAVALIRCYNDLVKMRSLASHPLNPRLYLEELAERYLRVFSAAKEA